MVLGKLLGMLLGASAAIVVSTADQQPMVERFGEYTLIEQIGVGGMAEVFLARRSGVQGFEKDIVIKRIRADHTTSEQFVEMFLGEAKLAAQLNHPNIVQIYDLGKIGDNYFIAMEYVAGRDLSSLIPKAKALAIPFPMEYALKIASNVCEALYYAHNKADTFGEPLHVVHRDVSPDNIRVAWTGTIKILDFGIAKAATQLHHTRAGEIKGKLLYMSPEQAQGRRIDHRADVFSLGAVLYECLTGIKLFAGDSDLAIMKRIVEGPVYPPSYFREDIHPGVEAIVVRALEREPQNRYQSAYDMQHAIDAFLSGHEFTPSNIHLANFLKQLYKDELAQEHSRNVKAARVAAADTALRPEQLTTPALKRRQRDASAMSDESVLVHLHRDQVAKLDTLARHHQISVDELLRDIIGHYIKYI